MKPDHEFNLLKTYVPKIARLPEEIEKQDLLHENFRLGTEGLLEMYFAPHNEIVNEQARIVIVGITPGWTQMKTAFLEVRQALHEGKPLGEAAWRAKQAARFAGTMRKNLLDMLDACGIPQTLQLSSANELFETGSDLLHTTSLIKYPVFKQGKNYTGYGPEISKSPMLSHYSNEVFTGELACITQPFLLIPLGKAVSEVINHLAKSGRVDASFCLSGFPHPSGANGHRKKQFEVMKDKLRSVVQKFGEFC